MKIFTAEQIKACDAYTIQQQGITSFDLMERAATACLHWIMKQYPRERPIVTLCGMGNNGGDGLALTRLLLQEGFSAKAIILRHTDHFSPDTAQNFTLLYQLAPEHVRILDPGMFVTELPADMLIIDALLGTGLNKPLEGWTQEFVYQINNLNNEVIAIDIPSGLPADNLPAVSALTIQADHTLSFQFYKRSFLHKEAQASTGMVHIIDIQLSPSYTENAITNFQTADLQLISKIYRKRNSFSHKGNYGDAMLVGGSYGKIGAIALATGAALKSGSGRVIAQAPECGYLPLQILYPEAMFLQNGKNFMEQTVLPEYLNTVMGMGPGMGTAAETERVFLQFLEQYKKSLVLDADALNLLAKNRNALHHLPPASVLTPHPKELERLFGQSENSMQQTELARAKAMKYNVYIVLKGHHTAILGPSGECWYNTTGNPGMATGGSGDVLTGIITGLMAQGYTSKDAALLGVYLHGLAADIASKELSEEALTAKDIIHYLSKAFLTISSAM